MIKFGTLRSFPLRKFAESLERPFPRNSISKIHYRRINRKIPRRLIKLESSPMTSANLDDEEVNAKFLFEIRNGPDSRPRDFVPKKNFRILLRNCWPFFRRSRPFSKKEQSPVFDKAMMTNRYKFTACDAREFVSRFQHDSPNMLTFSKPSYRIRMCNWISNFGGFSPAADLPALVLKRFENSRAENWFTNNLVLSECCSLNNTTVWIWWPENLVLFIGFDHNRSFN